MSVSLSIEDDFDISRGDMIVKENNLPKTSQELDVLVIWLKESPLEKRKKVLIKHTTNETVAQVTDILYELDINTLHKKEDINQLRLNSIGRVIFRTAKPIMFDNYKENRTCGSLIIIDPNTNDTIGAGILRWEINV